MRRLIRQFGCVLALVADVVEDQHHTADRSVAPTDRGARMHNRDLDTVVAHQQHGGGHVNSALFAQYSFDQIGSRQTTGFIDQAANRLQRQSARG